MIAYLKLLIRKIDEDQVTTGAAALAFYFSLAIFPALITMISIIPYLPIENLQEGLNAIIMSNLPDEASNLVVSITAEVVEVKRPVLLSTGFAFALWSASSGVMGIIQQINKVLEVKETRNYFKLRLIATGITILFGVLIIATIAFILYLSNFDSLFIDIIDFLVSFSVILLTFAGLYYLTPKPSMRFQFITPGSFFGAIGFILFVNGFKLYLSHFNNYSKTYGSLGGMIIFMLWLYVIGFLILLGAEINKTIETKKND
jgi:membrane protein